MEHWPPYVVTTDRCTVCGHIGRCAIPLDTYGRATTCSGCGQTGVSIPEGLGYLLPETDPFRLMVITQAESNRLNSVVAAHSLVQRPWLLTASGLTWTINH